jgi:hypothetical protein
MARAMGADPAAALERVYAPAMESLGALVPHPL